MNIVFDYQIFYLQRFGGISRYFLELAEELNKLDNCKAKIVAPFSSNEYIHSNKISKSVYNLNPVLKKILYNRYLDKHIQTNEWIAKKLSSRKHSLLHETYYTSRFKVPCKKVITIHDMIYELFNTGLEAEKQIIEDKKKSILEADGIIAVSENTRKDLLTFFPEVKSKTFVVHHGVSQVNKNLVKDYNHTRPFILYVGNRGWYKNFSVLLDTYISEESIHSKFDLIAFGGSAVDSSESEKLVKSGLSNCVHFIKGNDEMLNSLYKSAAVFVYNSKYEGFGMPVLEAMQMGCPVICSNTSSLPEVCGEAALTINPEEADELLQALKIILFDKQIAKGYSAKGLKRAESFTWKKCAMETKNIYTRILNG